MSDTADRFARIPFAVLDDPAFAEEWPDDARFATWVRLWMAADNAWPAPAPRPRDVPDEAFIYLVRAGLVLLSGTGLYRMGGMDDERMARPGAAGGRARAAVAARSRGRFTSALAQPAEPAVPSAVHSTSLQSTSLPASSNDANGEGPMPDESLAAYHARRSTQ